MLAQIYLKRGALVPMHAHESEQMTYVLQGALRFLVDGEEIIVREGEVLHIPPRAPHQAEALEDTFELDVFSPIRAGLARVDRRLTSPAVAASVDAPVDVVGAPAGVDVELAARPVDPPLQVAVLDLRQQVRCRPPFR